VKTAAAVVADPAAAATDAANKAAQTKADKLASKAKSWLDKLTTTKSKP
jgi:hypothetical protein